MIATGHIAPGFNGRSWFRRVGRAFVFTAFRRVLLPRSRSSGPGRR